MTQENQNLEATASNRNSDISLLQGGAGTDNSTGTSLTQDDLEDRQSRRKFRAKIFKRTGWLVCGLFLIWMITGIIAIFGASGRLPFLLAAPPSCLNLEKTAKYLLIIFGIVTSVLLAMFMAVISLAKEKAKKDDDEALIEIIKTLGSQLINILSARLGRS